MTLQWQDIQVSLKHIKRSKRKKKWEGMKKDTHKFVRMLGVPNK
jgi:hypothetical protein